MAALSLSRNGRRVAYHWIAASADSEQGGSLWQRSGVSRQERAGATAQAIPRPEHDRTATVSILAVPCHRDEMPAHDIAAALATKFRVPVAASCGFHVEAASDEDIQKVLATTKKLISSLEEACAPFFADTAQ